MRLTARILESVSGANSFSYATHLAMTEGDTPTIYLQLVDASRDRLEAGFVPAGRRYVPAEGARLQVTLDHIDQARRITRVARQPFPGDASIWSIPLLPSDKLRGTVNMKLELTEDDKVTYGTLAAALRVEPLDGMTRV